MLSQVLNYFLKRTLSCPESPDIAKRCMMERGYGKQIVIKPAILLRTEQKEIDRSSNISKAIVKFKVCESTFRWFNWLIPSSEQPSFVLFYIEISASGLPVPSSIYLNSSGMIMRGCPSSCMKHVFNVFVDDVYWYILNIGVMKRGTLSYV